MAYRTRIFPMLLAGLLCGLAPLSAHAFATADVDANNASDALTDGLLALRHQFGFAGDALIAGALGDGATRSDAAAIGAYLDSQATAFDVDGNLGTDALTDGLLLLRYLFGFRGDALIAGAVGAGATRTTAQAIEEYILGLTEANTPPDAKNDLFTTPDCGVINGNVLADNGGGPDVDADGDNLVVETTPVVAPLNGQLVLQANGLFSYTPDADLLDDTFTYRIDDGKAGTDTAVVTILVDPDYPADCILRLNHVQAKGSKNSFHVIPQSPQDVSHLYTQPSLTDQLALHGVRQFELDVHYRVDDQDELTGYEVFHLPFIDPGTTCQLFVDCLAEIKAWSDANPLHLPLMIWLEPKDDIDDDPNPILARTVDPDDTLRRFDGCFSCYEELEAEILSVFPPQRILKPDDVRGAHADLPTALAADGWPPLGQLRGRVMFALLDTQDTMDSPTDRPHRGTYLAPSSRLEGRLMFVDASDQPQGVDETAVPYAAMFKINNAQSEAARVGDLVAGGFVVTSNLDEVTADPDNDGTSAQNSARLADSLATGIHFGSTHYPADVGLEYWFDVPPGGDPARCNPLSTPALQLNCIASDIEALPAD